MRRTSALVLALPLLAFAPLTACGASQPAAPLPSVPAPPPAAVASAAPAVHAAAPPLPSGADVAAVDPSVSPCDDFFQYACGGWTKANPIPDDQAEWGRFDTLNEQNQLALRAVLEQDADKPTSDPYAKALGDLYASCMDEAGVEKDGLNALQPELKRIAAVSDLPSLAHELAHLGLMGVNPYFDLESQQDFGDATQEIATVLQSGLGLPDRDFYLNEDPKSAGIREKYTAHVERVFLLLGDKPERAKAEALAVFALEKELASKQISRADQRDPQKIYHKVDLDQLAKVAPSIPWKAYFGTVGLPKVAVINLQEPDYLKAVDARLAATPKGGWEAEVRPYLRWNLVSANLGRLPKRFVDERATFRREITGASKTPPRWKRCVDQADAAMGFALSIPFVKEKLGDAGKAATVDTVKSIEAAMQADLTGVAWLDDATRARALEKLHKIANMIGYPDQWRHYDGLVIDRKSNLGNVLRAGEFEARRELARVGKPVDRSEWEITPSTVNAYYDPSKNQMVFPAGILQTPFYSSSASPATNFGAIGMVMGHELTHGFDDEGRQFDGDGNLKDWWTPAVSKEFDTRASCVADQFSSYVAIDDVHLNGKLTLGENLADLGGLKLALAALRAKQPPSIEDDRRYFLGYADAWCVNVRPELARTLATIDPHSPPKWRVNGPLSNMPDFARAFSCQAGDAMVRPADKRCATW
jgi:endothelin-converting enzyme/putative endopeptidase